MALLEQIKKVRMQISCAINPSISLLKGSLSLVGFNIKNGSYHAKKKVLKYLGLIFVNYVLISCKEYVKRGKLVSKFCNSSMVRLDFR
jgi:hypothetical protein